MESALTRLARAIHRLLDEHGFLRDEFDANGFYFKELRDAGGARSRSTLRRILPATVDASRPVAASYEHDGCGCMIVRVRVARESP